MLWFLEGLRQPTKTLPPQPTRHIAGLTPGRPVPTPAPAGFDSSLCPTGALPVVDGTVRPDFPACIHCLRCRYGPHRISWTHDYRWGHVRTTPLPASFQRSVHVRVVDAGDCGACLNEVRQLSSPVYSLHRFGIYITPTPREADVLLVIGPVTAGMRAAVLEAYRAMPEPRRVLAVGVCAMNGGIFADSFAVAKGVPGLEDMPVDAVVPGCPPPPLAILDALRKLMGRSRQGREPVWSSS